MNLRLGILICILCALLTGCHNAPYVGDLTNKKPQIADITGLYRFEEQTLRESDILKKRFSTSKILLQADGTFKMLRVPNLINTGDKDTADISRTGKWYLEASGTVESFWGHEQPYWGIRFEPELAHLPSPGLMGSSKPYKLLFEYDDPDLGQVMIFSKP